MLEKLEALIEDGMFLSDALDKLFRLYGVDKTSLLAKYLAKNSDRPKSH